MIKTRVCNILVFICLAALFSPTWEKLYSLHERNGKPAIWHKQAAFCGAL